MCNSSYNLILILLKLCRHCDHALKICMWLGYTPQINYTPGIYEVYRGYIVFCSPEPLGSQGELIGWP